MQATILQEIRADRERTLAEAMRRRPLQELIADAEAGAGSRSECKRFLQAVSRPGGPNLIAEVKRASPSAGPIRPDLEPGALACAYAAGGASAVSVLTEPTFFKGSIEDLRSVRAAVDLPILRKDFIFHRYQLIEGVAAGADGALLIVGMLSKSELRTLFAEAHEWGLDCLVEVHNERELDEALQLETVQIMGINNRNLRTMEVDIETTYRLLPRIPDRMVVVSESGVASRCDVRRLGQAGVDAVLVGEVLARSDDPAAATRFLLQD